MNDFPTGIKALSEATESLLGRLADEFLSACGRGEQPSIEGLALRYPDMADVIRRLFPAMLFLKSAGKTPLQASDTSFDGRLGDFELIREIGRGGMGVVYEALQRSLGRRVALKVLPLAGILDERHLRRFQNEAHAAAVLQHPHIVPVHGVGCERGVHYYAMQLIDGLSLAEVLRRLNGSHGNQAEPSEKQSDVSTKLYAALSTQDGRGSGRRFRSIAQLAAHVADALEHAHREGVIHRDIKPSNLLLDQQGKVWIADFGLARVQADGELTRTGDLVGTLRYMSPEQLMDHRIVDHRTDVYSLGLTLYELLTRTPAFPRGEPEQLVRRILDEPPLLSRKLDPSIPIDLETIVLKATAKDAAERYCSAGELAEDLRRFVEQRPIVARRTSRRRRILYWMRRNPALTATLAILACVLLSLAIGGPIMAVRQVQLARDVRWNLNVANLNQAYASWHSGNVEQAERLLQRVEMQSEGAVGFARRYLSGKLRANENRTVFRGDGRIRSMSMSADGKWLAAGTHDGQVTLIDVPTLRVVRTLRTGDPSKVFIDFSPDGSRLALAARNRLHIYSNPFGDASSPGLDLSDEVSALRYSPNGSFLFVGLKNGQGELWRSDGSRLWTIRMHAEWVSAAAFSPDNRILATGGDDARIRLWKMDSGTPERDVVKLLNTVHCMAFSPDGERLAAGTVEGVRIWNTKSWSAERGLFYSLNPICSIAFSRHGMLATGGFDNLLSLWDVSTGFRLEVIPAHGDEVTGVKFTPDGGQLFTGGADGTIRVLDTSAAAEFQRTLSTEDTDTDTFIDISPCGKKMVSTAVSWLDPADERVEGELCCWDVPSGKQLWNKRVGRRDGADVAVSFKGDLFATCGPGNVTLWNFESGRAQRTLMSRKDCFVSEIAFSMDGLWLAALAVRISPTAVQAITSKGEGVLFLWDCRNLSVPPREVCMPRGRAEFQATEFSPDSRRLACVSGTPQGCQVDLLQLDNGQWHLRHPGVFQSRALSMSIQFLPKFDRFIAADWDGFVALVDLAQPQTVWKFRGESQTIFSADLSADGQVLATGSDRVIKLWDVQTSDQLASIEVSTWVSSLEFTPDGQTLVWGGGDGTVHFEQAPR